uniref:Uncharacterized protein n=1 Tax=Anguilla anguilla TaxID=7936 RepID=A0A0E9VTX7_ANGAN
MFVCFHAHHCVTSNMANMMQQKSAVLLVSS